MKMTMKIFKMLTILILMSSFFLMMFSNNPLMISMMVIIQCCSLSLTMVYLFFLSWFSYLIFMIYLGGILMLFSYIISMTYSKEPMMKKDANFWTITLIFILTFVTNMNKETFLEFMKMNMKELLISMYSNNYKITIYMIYFLLLIMIMVTYISESNKSSMRTM
uniref:NADH dehydrogenase subunit 6 n=1 Tax=Arorathrips mexicanus TaxID=1291224 RepID=UPI0030E0914F